MTGGGRREAAWIGRRLALTELAQREYWAPLETGTEEIVLARPQPYHRRVRAPSWCLLGVIGCTAGCASFDVPAYSTLLGESAARTTLVAATELAPAANRSARLPDRSQAEIKYELATLWQPSRRPTRLPNYFGIVATAYSQLETVPAATFQSDSIEVEHLGRRIQVPYIVAINPGKRLPLVIGVSGINSDADGKFTVDVLDTLYRSGDFHVLHVGSLTSVEHNRRNRSFFTGGLPEGLLLYRIVAELRRRPEFDGQIDQVHLLGVSYAGLLCGIAAHCETMFGQGIVDGAVLAFSPPMDLKLLFHNLDQQPFIYNRVREGYLVTGTDQFIRPARADLSEQELQELTFYSYMSKVALPYAQSLYPSLKECFPALQPFRDADDLYAVSSVRPVLATLGVPFLFVLAYDDPVLSPADHFQAVLAECPNSLVDGLLVKDGGHLGFDTLCAGFSARVADAYFRYWSVNLPRTRADGPRSR
jgi:predicted alpha/beta-fold hydrolase